MSQINRILVVGAGIAGPALCYWLKRFGFSPILIEKSGSIRKGGHAVDIRGVAIDVVKRMGIYDKICAKRTHVDSGRYVDAQGYVLHEEKGERFSFREGGDVEMDRSDLVETLMDAIDGVPCYFEHSIDRVQQSESDVKVRFKEMVATAA